MTRAVNESGRVEAFSDGVFAIAITRLVREIQQVCRHHPGPAGVVKPGAPELGPAMPVPAVAATAR